MNKFLFSSILCVAMNAHSLAQCAFSTGNLADVAACSGGVSINGAVNVTNAAVDFSDKGMITFTITSSGSLTFANGGNSNIE